MVRACQLGFSSRLRFGRGTTSPSSPRRAGPASPVPPALVSLVRAAVAAAVVPPNAPRRTLRGRARPKAAGWRASACWHNRRDVHTSWSSATRRVTLAGLWTRPASVSSSRCFLREPRIPPPRAPVCSNLRDRHPPSALPWPWVTPRSAGILSRRTSRPDAGYQTPSMNGPCSKPSPPAISRWRTP